jgi:hypothetical protein
VILRLKSPNCRPWFWGPNQKIIAVILMSKSPNHRPWFWGPKQETVTVILRPNHWQIAASDFEAKAKKLVLLVSSTCIIRIAHGITRPPDHLTTEYPTYVWSFSILCTKSPTPTSIFVTVHHVTFSLAHHETSNYISPNWITQSGASSAEMHQIQIQTKSS